MTKEIIVIGAGLAGSEAAWQAAKAGVKVTLYEMRPNKISPAHQTDGFAELVCSNSFRSDDYERNAVGLLHEEMRRCGSLIMQCAEKTKVPAGTALAVDRDAFSQEVTRRLSETPNITIRREEFSDLPKKARELNHLLIVATGPLTSKTLSDEILMLTGADKLAFFDAIAPIVYTDSIDFSKAWRQSRYDKVGPGGDGKDYINCPLNKIQYFDFIAAIKAGEKTEFKDWEKNTPYFEGCLPVEVMAERNENTLRFGPLKPVGLTDPNEPERRPYAVVQLRQDNQEATLYNMVGFQTKLKHAAQIEIFRKIPGLENAEFARLGGIHRNTFIQSPLLLDHKLRLKTQNNIFFAGQITGCEGYAESAAVGLAVGKFAAQDALNLPEIYPDRATALGSLLFHITHGGVEKSDFQPMNINFGLFPARNFTPEAGKRKVGKQERAIQYSQTALEKINDFSASLQEA